MSFDPRTSYAGDFLYHDFVDDASVEKPSEAGTDVITGLHARRADLDTTEFLGLAAGLALSSSAAAFCVWAPIDPDDDGPVELGLYVGCILRLAEDATGWVIAAHTRSRFGHYLMICDAELVNAAT